VTTCLYGIYPDQERLLAAAEELAAKGYRCSEAYTPHPVGRLSETLGQQPPSIPGLAFWVGLAAATLTYLVQWLLNAYSYPINVGARPPHFPLSYVPVCFEMGILFAALTAFVSVLVGGKLGRLWQPLLELSGFDSALRDRYWLELRVDAAGDVNAALAALRASAAERIVRAQEDPCAARS
jgi:uncharacterized membrane protein YhdT